MADTSLFFVVYGIGEAFLADIVIEDVFMKVVFMVRWFFLSEIHAPVFKLRVR